MCRHTVTALCCQQQQQRMHVLGSGGASLSNNDRPVDQMLHRAAVQGLPADLDTCWFASPIASPACPAQKVHLFGEI